MVWLKPGIWFASNLPALDQRIIIGSITFTSTLGLIVHSRSALIFVSENFGYIEIISPLITNDNAIMHTIDDQILSLKFKVASLLMHSTLSPLKHLELSFESSALNEIFYSELFLCIT